MAGLVSYKTVAGERDNKDEFRPETLFKLLPTVMKAQIKTPERKHNRLGICKHQLHSYGAT